MYEVLFQIGLFLNYDVLNIFIEFILNILKTLHRNGLPSIHTHINLIPIWKFYDSNCVFNFRICRFLVLLANCVMLVEKDKRLQIFFPNRALHFKLILLIVIKCWISVLDLTSRTTNVRHRKTNGTDESCWG